MENVKRMISVKNFHFGTFAVLYFLGLVAVVLFPQLHYMFFLFWGLGAYVINVCVNIFIIKPDANTKYEHKNPVLRLLFDMKPFKAWLALVILCFIVIVISFFIMHGIFS